MERTHRLVQTSEIDNQGIPRMRRRHDIKDQRYIIDIYMAGNNDASMDGLPPEITRILRLLRIGATRPTPPQTALHGG